MIHHIRWWQHNTKLNSIAMHWSTRSTSDITINIDDRGMVASRSCASPLRQLVHKVLETYHDSDLLKLPNKFGAASCNLSTNQDRVHSIEVFRTRSDVWATVNSCRFDKVKQGQITTSHKSAQCYKSFGSLKTALDIAPYQRINRKADRGNYLAAFQHPTKDEDNYDNAPCVKKKGTEHIQNWQFVAHA